MAFTSHAQWHKTDYPTGGHIYCLTSDGTNIFAGSSSGVFISTYNETSWIAVNNGLTNINVSAIATSEVNIYAGTRGGGVFLSTNNGTDWTAVNNGLTNTDVYSLAISGANIYAGTADGVFLSTNNGTSWNAVNNGLTNTSVGSLAICGTKIFAGTLSGVFLSTNNGSSWNAVNNGLTNTFVSSIATNGTNIFVGTYEYGGVYLSTDDGSSWNAKDNGLNTAVYSLAISGTMIFAGTEGKGVFLSTNNGSSWNAANDGMTDIPVSSLTIYGTNIFAGTSFGEIWMRPLSEITGISEIKNDNYNFSIYPNPTSQFFTIDMNKSCNEHLTLNIYDFTGKLIISQAIKKNKQLFDIWSWNLCDGIYIVELNSKNWSKRNKLIIK